MARRSTQSIGGSMDSLLDTMTNVVGIMVILLAVTQLGVMSAVNRIRDALPEISVEQYETMQERATANRALLDRLERQRGDAQSVMQEERERLEALRREVARLEQERDAIRIQDVARERAALTRLEEKERELVERRRALVEERTQLIAALQNTPQPQRLPAYVVRIPHPRPMPDGAVVEWFVCRNNALIHLDRNAYQERVVARLLQHYAPLRHGDPRRQERISAMSITEADVVFDHRKVQSFFEEQPFFVPPFRIYTHSHRTYNHLRLRLETQLHLISRDMSPHQFESRLRRLMMQHRGKPLVIRFRVHPDSFEAYLYAREIVDRAGLSAGWDLSTSDNWVTGIVVPRIRSHREEAPPPPSTGPSRPGRPPLD